MNCKSCHAEIRCNEHGKENIDELEDPDDMPFYTCVDCITQYKTAFGAIIHFCSDVIGLFGGEQQVGYNGDGRDRQNSSVEIKISDKQILEWIKES